MLPLSHLLEAWWVLLEQQGSRAGGWHLLLTQMISLEEDKWFRCFAQVLMVLAALWAGLFVQQVFTA